ncbi:ATP/GTP-binding protein [Schaalia sp. Marseille-Q2122]|uniref:AAA family ATPase n=1 Tax=Schaalia sp. Marseille-Q2122 TaxID=2736604 RepID=UPI001589FAA6|nr:ATP-binding protein [Schaalia sp. Marseille-Q2122]
MLLSFSVSGFRSFAEEATLDLTRRSFKTNVPREGQTWADCVEPIAAIYGPNASGKTTLIQAMDSLARALSSPEQSTTLLYQPCAAIEEPERRTSYDVDFVAEEVRYRYRVEVRQWGVSFEGLYAYPRGTARTLFERTQESEGAEMSFTKGPSLKGPSSEVLKLTTSRVLFLALAFRYEHSMLAPVASALASGAGVRQVSFREAADVELLLPLFEEMVKAPEKQRDLVTAVLKAGDLGIEKIDVRRAMDIGKASPDLKSTDGLWRSFVSTAPFVAAAVANYAQALSAPREKVFFTHCGKDGQSFELPLSAESSGTLTWLTIVWHALTTLRSGGVLLVDELDASLHPGLVRYIVELFASERTNLKSAQLIFTTHDVTLLGNAPARLLAPQNVWFVEKDDAGLSELFSLADFDNRVGNNSERRYMAGQFGAVPDVDDALLYDFLTQPLGG